LPSTPFSGQSFSGMGSWNKLFSERNYDAWFAQAPNDSIPANAIPVVVF